MPLERLTPTYPFTDDKLAQLRQIVPEAFEDGRLNFDTLREVLEPNLDPKGIVKDDSDRFGLNWPGKKEARRLAAIPSKGTLAPDYGEGLKPDGTPDTDGHNESRNVFIEGENLEVLKIMQKAYAGRIKMIYIDPPYNKDGDFLYDDNFTEPLNHYLDRTGQVDDEGRKLTTSTESDGRYHSNWLSMIYPRLRLARTLLREDGLIAISINEIEISNLQQVCREVFGQENYIGTLVWQSKKGGGSDSGSIVQDHEYVVLLTKNIESAKVGYIELPAEPLDEMDNQGAYRKGRELNKWGANSRKADRPTMYFPIPGPEGPVFPIRSDGEKGCWRFGKESMMKFVQEENILFEKKDDDRYIAYEKIRSDEPRRKPYRTWQPKLNATSNGTKTLKNLFDGVSPFTYSKPIDLIYTILNIGGVKSQDIVLDFFAGSGTTAHAVLNFNVSSGSSASYICVQMPEKFDLTASAEKEGFEHISDIAKERIRRINKRILEKDLPPDLPLGFRAFKLDGSQLINTPAKTVQELFVSEGKHDFDLTALLWEVALQEGFPLDSQVEVLEVAGQTVHRLTSDFHDFALLCCFDKSFSPAAPPLLPLGENDVLVCFDDALDDQTKLRLSDRGMLKTI